MELKEIHGSVAVNAKHLSVGENVKIGKNVVFCGVDGGEAESIVIGDNCFIGDNVEIRCNNFSVGDYARIHHNTTFHGEKPCNIGHNLWLGQYSLVDSQGGVYIGDNCGIGANSQLWSHIKFGDTLQGCMFNSTKGLTIYDDVWFVGHCIVSPIVADSRSMALVGSVVTKDMRFNSIYGGSPAKLLDIGPQFKKVSDFHKLETVSKYARYFSTRIQIVEKITKEMVDDHTTSYFDPFTRMYTKRNSEEERAFMNYLLPEKAKFIPYDCN